MFLRYRYYRQFPGGVQGDLTRRGNGKGNGEIRGGCGERCENNEKIVGVIYGNYSLIQFFANRLWECSGRFCTGN